MKIFISYAREDLEDARRIHTFLASLEEVSPWLDEKNMRPGDDWRHAVFTAIDQSRLFILVLSRLAFERKRFLHEEIGAALRRQATFPEGQPFIIPVRLDDCALVGEISRFHTIDLGKDWQTGLEQLRSSVVRALTASLSDAFRGISTYWTVDKRQHWIEDLGGYLLQFSATTVIRHLDKEYDSYSDEMYAVRLMIDVALAARSESLSAYVLRLHEIARAAHNYVLDTSAACGAFLDASKLVAANVHGMLLRHALESWLELGAVWGNTFTSCLNLLDVAKHYLAQREGRHQSDFAITLECIEVLRRYDLLLVDLLVFYARRTGDCDDLLSAVDLLAPYFRSNILAGRPAGKPREALLLRDIDLEGTEHVFSFANKPIMPMLLVRIGNCLCRSHDTDVHEYGLRLKAIGLRDLRKHRVGATLVGQLSSAMAERLVDALELHDAATVASSLGVEDSHATYLIGEIMITICSYSVPGLTMGRFASIDSRAFREHDEGVIGFRR